MQKIKFDFEATKERIYAPNSNVPIGAPVDRNGNIANDGNAYGIVLCKETENEKYWVRYNLVVMVAGYCDIIDAQEIWGDEYSAEAIAAMSDIVFCDDHKIGGGWPADLPKPSVGGYGYTEQGEQTVITWDGDTSGRDSLVLHGTSMNFNAYKVAEKGATYPNNATITVTHGGEEATGEAELVEYTNYLAYGTPGQDMVIIATAGEEITLDGGFTGIVPSDGVYFIIFTLGDFPVYATSLTYGTPDTIHKIDEKYLPAGCGAMVVEFTLNAIGNIIESATKTVEEVTNAMMAMPVVGVMKVLSSEGPESIYPLGCATANWSGEPVFLTYDTDDSAWVLQIYVENGEWKPSVLSPNS